MLLLNVLSNYSLLVDYLLQVCSHADPFIDRISDALMFLQVEQVFISTKT